MEPTTPVSFKEKLGNAFANMKFMMQSDKRILFGVIGISVLVIIFIIMAVMSLSRSKKEELITTQSPASSTGSSQQRRTTSIPKIPATLSFSLSNPKVYKVNDTITFTIIGDTAGTQVRGYDVAFKFDTDKVQFVSEKNLYPSFNYQRRIRNNWVIITSTQPLNANKKTIFTKTPLMSVTFKATAPGTAYFPISYIPNSFNDSNLIDTASNDMLSNATGLVVQIQP